MSGRKKRFLYSSRLFSLIMLSGTVLVLALSAFDRLHSLPEEDSNHSVTQVSVIPSESAVRKSVPETLPAMQSAEPAVQPEAGDWIHLLLIGKDSREPDSPGRSDAMILCSVSPDRQSITMISFLRDLYVQIPGYASNRLNAAYAFGGMPLLKQTFSDNFAIPLNGCIEVDFQQFIRLVDLMGGVSLTLRRDEAELLNRQCNGSELSEGSQHLDGQQALAYSRIRALDPDGDFSRTQRQRKLLTALLEQFRKCSLPEMISVITALRDLISTDLTGTQITAYLAALLPIPESLEVKQLRIPADGTYSPKVIDGMEVLVDDRMQTKNILQNALSEE